MLSDGIDGVGNGHAHTSQLAKAGAIDRHACRLGIDNGVELAAVGNVGAQAHAWERHLDARMQDKRRHVGEQHACNAGSIGVATIEGRPDGSSCGVEGDATDLRVGRQQPALECDGRDRDDAMAAHAAEPLVVHEQHAGVRARLRRLGENRTPHVRVPARLEHQDPAKPVGPPRCPVQLVAHGAAAWRREAVHDEPKWRTGHVRIDGPDGDH